MKEVLELQGAMNELAAQNLILRDRAVNLAADLSVARARVAELEKQIKAALPAETPA